MPERKGDRHKHFIDMRILDNLSILIADYNNVGITVATGKIRRD